MSTVRTPPTPSWLAELQRPSPNFTAVLQTLEKHLPLLGRMKDTPQDRRWHAEGNVETHTLQVCAAAAALAEEHQLTPENRTVLLLSALLHDAGKVTTTRVDQQGTPEEQVRSTGHPAAGRDLISLPLLEILPPEVLWPVMELVGAHHEVSRAAYDPDERRVQRLARQADLPLLALLHRADGRGRTLSDTSGNRDHEITADLLELLASEHGLWDDRWADWQRWQVGTDHPDARVALHARSVGRNAFEQGEIHSPEEAISRALHARSVNNLPLLMLLAGPSGSGKTTVAAELQRKPGARNSTVVSLDAIREELGIDPQDQPAQGTVLQHARTKLKRSLAAGNDTLWDATCLTRNLRGPLLQLGLDYHAITEIHWRWTTPSAAQAQNARRAQPVPEATLHSQVRRWQSPAVGEAGRLHLHLDFQQVTPGEN